MKSSRRSFLKQVSLSTLGLWGHRGFAESAGVLLPRGSALEAGVSEAGIMAFLEAIDAAQMELHSLMILRHGKVIAEGWWDPYGPQFVHTMYSMSKSFTSTAVGLAVAEGKMSVDDKVISFFPDDLPAKISDNLAAMKVKHLLTMTPGNEKEPTGKVVSDGELGADVPGAGDLARAWDGLHLQQCGHLHVQRDRAKGDWADGAGIPDAATLHAARDFWNALGDLPAWDQYGRLGLEHSDGGAGKVWSIAAAKGTVEGETDPACCLGGGGDAVSRAAAGWG